MRYRFQEVLAHCQKNPRAWTEIHQRGQISPDHQWFETETPIPGLRPYREPIRGLGDLLARILEPLDRLFGLKQECGPCARRQARLNRIFPLNW